MSANPHLVNPEVKANPVNVQPDGANPDLTIQQEAYLLHLIRVKALREQMEKEAAQLRERQDKIRFVHEIMQEINNAMDANGNLDLKNLPELQKKLKAAADLGIKLPAADKTSFNQHESRRILDNLHYGIEDWEKEDGTQMRKLQNLYTESEQSIMIVKDCMSKIDRPIRSMIAGIKGS